MLECKFSLKCKNMQCIFIRCEINVDWISYNSRYISKKKYRIYTIAE